MQNYASSYWTCTHVVYWKFYQHIYYIFNFDTDKEKYNQNVSIVPVDTPLTHHRNE